MMSAIGTSKNMEPIQAQTVKYILDALNLNLMVTTEGIHSLVVTTLGSKKEFNQQVLIQDLCKLYGSDMMLKQRSYCNQTIIEQIVHYPRIAKPINCNSHPIYKEAGIVALKQQLLAPLLTLYQAHAPDLLKDHIGLKALHLAIKKHEAETVRQLLAGGVPKNIPYVFFTKTPMLPYRYARKRHQHLCKKYPNSCTGSCELLEIIKLLKPEDQSPIKSS